MTHPTTDDRLALSRRRFLTTTALGAAGAVAATSQAKAGRAAGDDGFEYEITRTDAEWRERLSEAEYKVLRNGNTELPKTSSLWEDYREGSFNCRGCDLEVYASNWRVPLDKGWVFFAHSEPNAVLMGIDGPQEMYGMDPNGFGNLIESHCRRCGSHLGHILIVGGELLHCINGVSLDFQASEA